MPENVPSGAENDASHVNPPPPTSSSSSSSGSSTTSAVILLSPSALHHTVPLPTITVHVHPILATGSSTPTPLLYNLTLPPSTALSARTLRQLPTQTLAEPATFPPQPFLVFDCPFPFLWPLTVMASNPHDGVTVEDVLNGVYSQLFWRASETDYASLPTLLMQEVVSAAFRQRYESLPDKKEREKEKAGGLKRVDFLCGMTMWMGLSSTDVGPDRWVLNVGQ